MKLELVNGRQLWTFNCEVAIAHTIPRPTTDVGRYTHSRNDGMVRDRWRLLSAVEAWPSSSFWLPQLVDYGHEGGAVLQDIIPLVNQYKPDLTWDHSNSSRDIAGYIENATWEQSTDIPVGVNADLVVDPTYDEKAAYGLRTGKLRNGSIGISMRLEKSHPDMDFDRFVEAQGEIVDGVKCRWLPVKITAVHHMALVPAGAGADPNAGKRAGNARADNRRGNMEKSAVDRALNQMFVGNNEERKHEAEEPNRGNYFVVGRGGNKQLVDTEQARTACNRMFTDNEDSEKTGHNGAFQD